MVDVPVPTPQPGMILIKTAASLVSAGTERMVVEFAEKSLLGKVRSRPDLAKQVIDKARREGVLSTVEAAFNRLDQPMALGYSSAGTIIEIGEGVEGFRVGQRVACAGGGYAVHAEYAVVPANLVAPLPDNVDFESGAFGTLGSIALHGFRLGQPQVGETVAVIGLGLLGLISVGLAKAAGCRVFGVDLDPARVELARQMGAEAVGRAEAAESAAMAFTEGFGADVVLICADAASNDPVELAGAIAVTAARWWRLVRWGWISRARFIFIRNLISSSRALTGRDVMTPAMRKADTITRSASSAGRRDATWGLLSI